MNRNHPPAIVFAGIDNVPLAIDEGHRRLPALLATLADERIILVFCSFRARAEVEGFRQSIGVFHPFVCENGAAVFVPTRYFGSELHNARSVGGYEAIEFGLRYDLVVERLRRVADQYRLGIRGFADMSIEQVARECGLSLLDARLAKLREYGEPFRLLRPDHVAQRRMVSALESAGVWCTPHGAFLHAASVLGAGPAAAVLISLYKAAFGPILTAAAGGDGMSAVMARVDAGFDGLTAPGRVARGETLAWIEHLVDRVRSAREVAAMTGRPHATAVRTPALPR